MTEWKVEFNINFHSFQLRLWNFFSVVVTLTFVETGGGGGGGGGA